MSPKYSSKYIAVEKISPFHAAVLRGQGSPCDEFTALIELAKQKLPPGRCATAVMLSRQKFLVQIAGIGGSTNFILHLSESIAADLFDPQVVA